MPREIVQFADTTRDEPSSIDVVWSKPEGGGNLQLHFQRHNFGGIPDEHRRRSEQPATVDQYSDQLSRDDCNRMIRALRRARDAVYGADA